MHEESLMALMFWVGGMFVLTPLLVIGTVVGSIWWKRRRSRAAASSS